MFGFTDCDELCGLSVMDIDEGDIDIFCSTPDSITSVIKTDLNFPSVLVGDMILLSSRVPALLL